LKISKELKAGIIVLGGVLLVILGLSYLKANPLFKQNRVFYAVYENVEGLAVSTNVTINGFAVGKVSSIEFLDDSAKLLVTFMVDSDFEFSKTSKVEIYEPGLIGGKALAILPAFDGAPMAVDADTLATSRKAGLSELVNQRLEPLQQKLEGMLESADTLLVNINSLLDNKTKNDLKNSLLKFNQTISSFNGILADNREKLGNTIDNFDKSAASLAVMSEDLSKAELSKTMAELKTTIAGFNSVIAKIDKGEGSIGKLLNDEKLYENLTGASKQMEALLEDMKLNPKRYVHFSLFGKKPDQYDPPADAEIKN
jgi:phospholipid/cholesterol/gamma-HCH transport system substrate-binding protein